MKKILMMNLNVSGGIEYCGDVFCGWLGELDNVQIIDYKTQKMSTLIVKDIIEIEPDIIVINETIESLVVSCYFYKTFRPETKIILLLHSWKAFDCNEINKFDNQTKREMMNNQSLFKVCDYIFVLNCMPKILYEGLNNNSNIINGYFPVDNDVYKVKTEWKDRNKRFLCLGSLSSMKFSTKFIDLLSETKVFIDCYGYKLGDDDFIKKFESCPNLIYKGKVLQKDVPDLLNEYKYTIFPHVGYEIFNISLLQSILCGTVPLVSNDRTTNSFDYTWIDWAAGLYFGCNKEEELISNLKELLYVPMECNDISKDISKMAAEKFSYEKMKSLFLDKVKILME